MFKIKDTRKFRTLLRFGMIIAFGSILALLLILPVRAVMNALSRIDYVYQRLDDYPRMHTAYLEEADGWNQWWLREIYDERARQAAFLYDADEKHPNGQEKLSYISKILRAEKALIVSPEEYKSLSEKNAGTALYTSSAALPDGNLIALMFHGSDDVHTSLSEDKSSFMSQLEAGLLGYVCVLRDGTLTVYPEDENAEALKSMIGTLIENGTLDPAALAEKARNSGQKTALKAMLNPKTDGVPARKYLLYCAAYRDIDDLVINVSDSEELFRFGRKRSWALWFLCCSILFLLGRTLWKTRLYIPAAKPEEEHNAAVKKGISAMFMAALLLFGSVFVIQMLSSVNLAQQGATDQSDYLKNVLRQESGRAAKIEGEFDAIYLSRANTAAALLSDNPQLIDTDRLHDLDTALNGSGLRVFDVKGQLLASDELLHSAIDTSMIHLTHSSMNLQQDEEGRWTVEDEENMPTRYYRAIMTDQEGKISGWVELCVEQKRLDDLQRVTSLTEVIGDLHILDTMHAIAIEKGDAGKILASTFENWVGDSAKDHGIHPELSYDGYEGIVNFDGNKCYSVVFTYNGNPVIVGSENESALIFIGGVLILTWLLAIMTMMAVYQPLVRLIVKWQKQEAASAPEKNALADKSEYPLLRKYVHDFMIAVFLMSFALYVTTKGNPTSLTYNIVRGTWIRGINAATVTTCIMLASVVFAVQRLIDIMLLRLGKYLSPRGMTICRLLDSAFTYIGVIVMIIYALSMFGVDTTTLIGGVGATALIFTLGANSLIADVLAGVFIIFEGDFTVGDVVVIDDFRGIVTDISMRTTKLMDDNTRDIKIISNSAIRDLTNQSREHSSIILDIPISRSIGLEKGEKILKEAILKLPDIYPKIIGEPEYWGVSKLPEKNMYTGKLGGFKARIAFNCLEKDKEMLTYQVSRSLIALVAELNQSNSPGPDIVPGIPIPPVVASDAQNSEKEQK